MHGIHARLPKNFVLEERIERYGQAIELVPRSLAGRWAEACAPLDGTPFREVRVDLGCGKASFLCESAAAEPDVLFIGIDGEPMCVVYAAKQICDSGVKNALVVPGTGEQLKRMFDGEVSLLHINFPTPYPRKKDAPKRLVLLERLLEYRHVLAPGGRILFKTDSQPLFAFAKTQFDLAGYAWEEIEPPADMPTSLYEDRLVADGATVLCIEAAPGEDPGPVEQTAELSLIKYLPQDLEDLEALPYVPLGMTGTVTNLKNRMTHERQDSQGVALSCPETISCRSDAAKTPAQRR